MKSPNAQHIYLRRLIAFILPAVGIGLFVSNADATPAPNQLVWQLPGQSMLEQQGVSVGASFDVTPILFAGLQTAASNDASGNHISVRAYSGVSAALLFTIPAPAQVVPSANVLATIGDVNGDAKTDFAVGTPLASSSGPFSSDTGGVVRLFDSGGTLLHTFTGSGNDAQFGYALDGAGDVDGDGAADLIIGAPGANAAYVFSGSSAKSYGLIAALYGSAPNEAFGFSVAMLGQLGSSSGGIQPVVLVGAPFNQGDAPSGGHGGRIYAIQLNPQPFPPGNLYSVAGSGATDLLGMSVDGGIDISGDGVSDFLGGAVGSNPQTHVAGTGYVRLYSGANGSTMRTISSSMAGDLFGAAARFAGPCLSTSRTIVVGAPQALNIGNGQVTGRVLSFNALSGAQLTEIYGEHQGEGLGTSVAAAPDLSGEGEAEFLTGSPGTPIPPFQTGAGAAWAFSCRAVARPKIDVMPSPASFGAVTVGGISLLDIGITNLGTAKLDVTNIALDPQSSPALTYIGPPVALILPSTTQTVTVRFGPMAPGLHVGKLHVASNDPLRPSVDVNLTGLGSMAQLQVTPVSIAFGAVDVNDTGWAPITMRNIGNAPVTVQAITMSGGSSPNFSFVGLPAVPLTLGQNQAATFKAVFKPSSIGAQTGVVQISSDDPVNPGITVSLSGQGVQQNKPPTAVIKMDVPYAFNNGTNQVTIQFRGDSSHDFDGNIVSYQWDFGDGVSSTTANPSNSFAYKSACPCYYIVRLTVTDDRGKRDSTSVTIPVPKFVRGPTVSAINATAVTLSDKEAMVSQGNLSTIGPGLLRSRFWGTARRGGVGVPEGSVVEAWMTVNSVFTRVAESLTQVHLGESVFAIEIPPDSQGNGPWLGGTDGDKVNFRIDGADANESGTWWNATDQRLDLTAPGSFIGLSPCVQWPDMEICTPSDHTKLRLKFDLIRNYQPPQPDPNPLRHINTFKLDFTNIDTGIAVSQMLSDYEIRTSYSDAQIAAAGITDERTLSLYYLNAGQWVPAGSDTVDVINKQVITRLNHASIFALMGKSSSNSMSYRIYLPYANR